MFYAPNNATSIQFKKKFFINVLSFKGSTCPCSFLLAISQGAQFVEQRIQHGCPTCQNGRENHDFSTNRDISAFLLCNFSPQAACWVPVKLINWQSVKFSLLYRLECIVQYFVLLKHFVAVTSRIYSSHSVL